MDYYYKSIDLIKEKVKHPKFYIFSDDIEWVKKNLKFPKQSYFVDFQEDINSLNRGASELLNIFSSCKHFIIANSTFSWWGSWLSKNENKIIITPKPWFYSRYIISADTISKKTPIYVENNEKKKFDDSSILLFELLKDIDKINFIDINYKKTEGNYFKISTLNENSKIILPYFSKKQDNSSLIIKLSLKSKNYGQLFFNYTSSEGTKLERKKIKFYHYENDKFTHYIILHKPHLTSNIIISFSEINNNYELYNLEVKEL